jgi:hypothetical protein
LAKKPRKYNKGDLVLFKKITENFGDGKGTVRDSALPFFEGEFGEIVYLRSSSPKYPYYVRFKFTAKSGRQIDKSYCLAEAEIEPVFTV